MKNISLLTNFIIYFQWIRALHENCHFYYATSCASVESAFLFSLLWWWDGLGIGFSLRSWIFIAGHFQSVSSYKRTKADFGKSIKGIVWLPVFRFTIKTWQNQLTSDMRIHLLQHQQLQNHSQATQNTASHLDTLLGNAREISKYTTPDSE